jgi:hypothetical protein
MLSDSATVEQTPLVPPISKVQVKIEPDRLFPCKIFVFNPGTENLTGSGVRVIKESGVWSVIVRIPLERIRLGTETLHPIRINVLVQKSSGGSGSWLPDNLTTERLILGSDNPADLGWLMFR